MTATKTATRTATQTPTGAPSPRAGIVNAPPPITVSASVGKTVKAGSFRYTNRSGHPQQIRAVTVTISDPAALTSISVSVDDTSGSVSPVSAVTTIQLGSPVSVNDGDSLRFVFSAQTSENAVAARSRIVYASLVADRSPITPLNGGMIVIGLLLMPLGVRRRRRTILIALGVIGLMIGAAGCSSGGGGSAPASIRRTVDSSGRLNAPARLSTITVKGGGNNVSSVQSVTALSFDEDASRR